MTAARMAPDAMDGSAGGPGRNQSALLSSTGCRSLASSLASNAGDFKATVERGERRRHWAHVRRWRSRCRRWTMVGSRRSAPSAAGRRPRLRRSAAPRTLFGFGDARPPGTGLAAVCGRGVPLDAGCVWRRRGHLTPAVDGGLGGGVRKRIKRRETAGSAPDAGGLRRSHALPGVLPLTSGLR